jgi:hypothetical protein
MAFKIADLVQETTATTGTGTINLAGAATQCQSFISGIGSGNNCEYCLASGNGTDEEIGIGTVTSGSPNTLSRDTVLSSTNSGAKISLSGTSIVFSPRTAVSLRKELCAPIFPPARLSNWTQRNGGSATPTWSDVSNGINLADVFVTTSGVGITLSAPSTPYTIDANLSMIASVSSGSNLECGVGFSDGTKVEMLNLNLTGNNALFGVLALNQYSSLGSFHAGPAGGYGLFNIGDLWIRIADNGTVVTYSGSHDGVYWLPYGSITKSGSYLGSGGYTNVGFFDISGALGNNGLMTCTLRSWWQH